VAKALLSNVAVGKVNVHIPVASTDTGAAGEVI